MIVMAHSGIRTERDSVSESNDIRFDRLLIFSFFIEDFGANPLNPIEKTNYMPGGVYNPSSGSGLGVNYGNYGNSYGSSYGGGSYGGGSYGGNRNPYPLGGGSINGPYPGTGMGMGGLHGGLQGLFPQDLEGKSSLILPIAGAALLGLKIFFICFCSINNNFVSQESQRTL